MTRPLLPWLLAAILSAGGSLAAETAAAAFPRAAVVVKLERIPFAAELLPSRRPVNFWAYQEGTQQYIPATALGHLLGAKIHRYDKSAAITLHLNRQKSLHVILGEKRLLLGSKELRLERPIARSPEIKDLLIPIEAIESWSFRDYTQFDIELLDDNKLTACPIETLDLPSLTETKDYWDVLLRLQKNNASYGITFHPPNAKIKTPAKLILRLPYTKIAPTPKQTAANVTALAGIPWSAGTDPNERSLLLSFALPKGTTFDQIEATEETWPSKRLHIKIAKSQISRIPPTLESKSPVSRTAIKHGAAKPTAAPMSALPQTRSAAASKKPVPAATGNRSLVIMLDAGHGGKDSGAINRAGIKEKDLALQLTLKLSRAIKKKIPSAQIVLSRGHDATVPLTSRVYIARNKNSDIFISIHANAARTKNRGGFEVYIPSVISLDPATAEVIRREHSQEPSKKTKKISPEASLIRQSEALAQSVSLELDERIGERINNRGIIRGDFLVLRESAVPSVLIEAGFLTHANDVRYLVNPKFQDAFAEAVAQGVAGYIKGAAAH
ncbi:MAG: N-acetylmuramoyl-L-alanine amidase [Elusimicrobia bacterium]|nr:N-acetylmuramoyl-L-alanine amidase [Elusimicrobiota bacterium]